VPRDPKTYDYAQEVEDAFDAMSDEEFLYVTSHFLAPVVALERYSPRHAKRWFALIIAEKRVSFTTEKERRKELQ